MRELLLECCQRLDRKEFTCTGIDRNIPGLFFVLIYLFYYRDCCFYFIYSSIKKNCLL